MATARYNGSSAGTGTAALAAGGNNNTANLATTEEWTVPSSTQNQTLTAS